MPNIVQFTQMLNVLIVEDDKAIREQLQKIFSRRFNCVDVACNGEEAYIQYQKMLNSSSQYDVIVSDINMPIMNGLDFLKKIRQKDKDTAVVFISGRNESHLLLEAITYGVNSYMIKPINYDLLTLKIKEISTMLYYKNQYEKKEKECAYYLSLLNEHNISLQEKI